VYAVHNDQKLLSKCEGGQFTHAQFHTQATGNDVCSHKLFLGGNCVYLAHICMPHIKRLVPMYIGGELKHLSVSAYFVQCFISVLLCIANEPNCTLRCS